MDSRYSNFDAVGFEKKITGTMKEAPRYCNIIKKLRRYIIVEHDGKFPKDISKVLCDYIKETARESEWSMYCKAISKYEAVMLNGRGILLYGSEKAELKKRDNIKAIQEPYYSRRECVKRINAVEDKKFQKQLLLQLYSGIRLSEICDLREEDIEFLDSKRMKLHVREAKGGLEMYVTTLENEDLVKRMKEDPSLYTRSTYEAKARDIGILTHDLRKHNIRDRYKKYRKEGRRKNEAAKMVQKDVGHETLRMTKGYIGSAWQKY